MKEYGFEKVKVQSFMDIYQDAEIEAKNSNVNMASRMSEIEKEFSFLNNAFVYQKKNNTPDIVVKKLKEMIEKDVKKVKSTEKVSDVKKIKIKKI